MKSLCSYLRNIEKITHFLNCSAVQDAKIFSALFYILE
jgi:hypothetical protein